MTTFQRLATISTFDRIPISDSCITRRFDTHFTLALYLFRHLILALTCPRFDRIVVYTTSFTSRFYFFICYLALKMFHCPIREMCLMHYYVHGGPPDFRYLAVAATLFNTDFVLGVHTVALTNSCCSSHIPRVNRTNGNQQTV
jgi:hypothetical protein